MTQITFKLYWAFSIVFMASLSFLPYSGSFLIKSLPSLIMAAFFLVSRTRLGIVCATGFIFSAAGDIFLDLDRQKYFIYGLGSFLVAHVFYTTAFLKFFDRRNGAMMKVLPLAVFGPLIAMILLPKLGGLTWPVLSYLCVFVFMGLTAAFSSKGISIGYIGAVSFILSDTLIAIGQFLSPVPMGSFLVMITYYTGNFLIGIDLARRGIVNSGSIRVAV